jgi:hypothetical protein
MCPYVCPRMRLHVCPYISLIDCANGTLQGDAFTQLGDSERGAKELIVDCCARHILAQVLIYVPLHVPLYVSSCGPL